MSVYNDMVKEVILFLKGRTPDLINKVQEDMLQAAARQDYEKAALLRDKMAALTRTVEKQVVVSTDFKDRDVIAFAKSDGQFLVSLMIVRGGFLLGMRHYQFSTAFANDAEIIDTFLHQYYKDVQFIPKEILIPIALDDTNLLEERLEDHKGEKVRVLRPQRGAKAKLVHMAHQNAERELKERMAALAKEQDLLLRLQHRLRINRLPRRIAKPVHFTCNELKSIARTRRVAKFELCRSQ